MKAPRCQVCGVEEWGHLCGGWAPSEIERRATRGAVTKTPVTKTMSVTKTPTVTKTSRTGLLGSGAREAGSNPVRSTSKSSKGGRPRKGEGEVLSAAERARRYRAALRALREGKDG